MAHLSLIERAILSADQFYTVDVKALNNSGADGTVLLTVEGTTLSIMSQVDNTTPDQVHIQHIHGTFNADGTPSNARIPGPRNDTDLDGFVEVAEGAAAYGDILLPIEDQSDGFNNDPVADGEGRVAFYGQFDLSDDSQFLNPLSGTQYTGDDLMPLTLREYVIHGRQIDQPFGAGTEGAIDGTTGYKLSLPIGAGEIEEITQGQAFDILEDLTGDAGMGLAIQGTDGDDTFDALIDGATFFGNGGTDTLIFDKDRAEVDVEVQESGRLSVTDGAVSSELVAVERIAFDDGALLLGEGEIGTDVALLYAAAFDRTPDEAGLRFWIGQAEQGRSLDDIADSFVAGPEFAETFGAGLSDDAFVGVLYDTVLDRSADADGLAFWQTVLSDPAMDRGDVLVDFSLSDENRAAAEADISDGLFVV